MRSPSQQVGKCQPGATELVVEADTKIVQGHPRRQSSPQTTEFVGTLTPEAENFEEFVVDGLDELTGPGHPPPQTFRPGLLGVALGRMDDLRAVVIETAPMVFGTLETFVGYVSPQESRARAYEPGVRISPELEEGLGQRLVGVEIVGARDVIGTPVDKLDFSGELVGVKEATGLAGKDKANFLRDLASREDFPEPIVSLASGRY